MNKNQTGILLALLVLLSPVAHLFAATDYYMGDTTIYSGSASADPPPPNILFIVDNNSTMENAAGSDSYSNQREYSGLGNYDAWSVYKLTGQANYPQHIIGSATVSATPTTVTIDPDGVPSSGDEYDITYNTLEDDDADTNTIPADFLPEVTCAAAREALYSYGTYSASGSDSLKSDGTCGNGGAGTTYLGNLLNYNEDPNLTNASGETQIEIIYNALNRILDSGIASKVNIGLMLFGDNNKGGSIPVAVQDISSDPEGLFLDFFPGYNTPFIPGNSRPMAEALAEAQFYFDMDRTTSTSPISNRIYPDSPITEMCQKNVVVFITNGDSIGDSDGYTCNLLTGSTQNGDYDGDGQIGDKCQANSYGNGTHMLDDMAKYAYDTDLSSTLDNIPNKQRLETHTLLVFSPHKDLLESAAEEGHGTYTQATSAAEISDALGKLFESFLLETDTAFVAPVVPTSPENRTYSGQRVYLGFFYPRNEEPWSGNLKKFGIDINGDIVDKNGVLATEENGDFKDSNNTGTFTTSSYWSTEDAGRVNEGGVGEILLNRGFTNDTSYSTSLPTPVTSPMSNPSRNIYTYLDSSNSAVTAGNETTALTNVQNRFYTGNTNILYNTTLDLTVAADKNKLILYVHGLDSYDDDGDGSTIDMRGDDPTTTGADEDESWIMGDILHSKPSVINYETYTFSPANEANCSVNKSTIFVGANDGMLHAFRDCDGHERWAFIPPDILQNLKTLTEDDHTNFVDGTPVPYVYDADQDGNIETADGDKAIILFGLRRGGSSYHALDVSVPDAPVYLWSIDASTLTEMGQSWSTPSLGLIKDHNGNTKLAAFIGAGYDNNNEDGRFGDTQGFTDVNPGPSSDSIGAVTSTANVTPTLSGGDPVTNNHKGRGIYAIEIATINSGIPNFSNSGSLIWSYTFDTTSDGTHSNLLNYSIASDITILDTDYDNYIDRLYVGDTGGQLWRFSQTNSSIDPNSIDGSNGTNGWSAVRLFNANPGADGTNGRKIFYRPSVTSEIGGVYNIYFGTGDRAHPLNTDVVDRIYAVYDRGQTTASAIDEDNLFDVTDNLLQASTTDPSEITTILNSLYSNSNYGWFIDLVDTSGNLKGEKVLAQALAFNKVVYNTTFTPNLASTDPCIPGNLGISRLYAVDYLTGEAVLNFSATNDSLTTTNSRAKGTDGNLLERQDRSTALGIGIPSGIVVVIPPGGDAGLLIGCGGGLCAEEPVLGGTLFPIYWRPM